MIELNSNPEPNHIHGDVNGGKDLASEPFMARLTQLSGSGDFVSKVMFK